MAPPLRDVVLGKRRSDPGLTTMGKFAMVTRESDDRSCGAVGVYEVIATLETERTSPIAEKGILIAADVVPKRAIDIRPTFEGTPNRECHANRRSGRRGRPYGDAGTRTSDPRDPGDQAHEGQPRLHHPDEQSPSRLLQRSCR